MSSRRRYVSGSIIARVAVTLAIGSLVSAAHAQDRSPALAFDRAAGFRAEIVNMRFAESLAGRNRTLVVNEEGRNTLRMALVTVRITKPAGVSLTLACADITLHYYHTSGADVSPCRGLSTFSTVLETDRELELTAPNAGSGFMKKTTLASTEAASTVFIDVAFAGMESSTREAWIAIGQIDEVRPFISEGWSPEASSATPCIAIDTIALNASASGSWAPSCTSSYRPGRYARFFTFTLTATTTVQIDLTSSTDAFVALLQGQGASGPELTQDDDGGGGTNARISRRLEPGTYTIEATTFASGTTGTFMVRVSLP